MTFYSLSKIVKLLPVLFLIADTASSQTTFYPNSVIGQYQRYPYVSAAAAGIVLVGFTNEPVPGGRYTVVQQQDNGWLGIASAATGWSLRTESFATDITHARTGDIVVTGRGMLMSYNPSDQIWTRFETDSGDIERRFTSANATDAGVLLPCATFKIISRDTVNGVVRSIGKMYFEAFILEQNNLKLLIKSSPEERRPELGNFVTVEGVSFAGFFHSNANDTQDIVRIQDGVADFVDIGVETPRGMTPRACVFADGSIGLLYGRGLNESGMAVRWHPTNGIVYARAPQIPGLISGLIAIGNSLVAISSGGSMWTYDGSNVKIIKLVDIAGPNAQPVNGIIDLKEYGSDLYITTDIGLFIINKSLLVPTSVDAGEIYASTNAFPNPASGDYVFIPIPNGVITDIKVISIRGETLNVNIDNDGKYFVVPATQLASGTYYAVAVQEGRTFVRPFRVLR